MIPSVVVELQDCSTLHFTDYSTYDVGSPTISRINFGLYYVKVTDSRGKIYTKSHFANNATIFGYFNPVEFDVEVDNTGFFDYTYKLIPYANSNASASYSNGAFVVDASTEKIYQYQGSSDAVFDLTNTDWVEVTINDVVGSQYVIEFYSMTDCDEAGIKDCLKKLLKKVKCKFDDKISPEVLCTDKDYLDAVNLSMVYMQWKYIGIDTSLANKEQVRQISNVYSSICCCDC